MTTALITHPACALHETPPGHAECPARLDAVLNAVKDLDLMRIEAPLARSEDILRAHPAEHLVAIEAAAPREGQVQLDPDTYMSPGSLEAARRAVGGAVQAVDLVMEGTADNAFSACRPPGHHAEKTQPMGFCLFGSIAIAAKYALDHHGLDRVAIVDFDVHHGNGTQDLVQDDPRILFVSTHQMPLYPNTGDPSDTGPHGTVMNRALSAGDGGDVFRALYEQEVFPRLEAFAPQMIFVSAGFDAHADDPLAQIRLSTEEFRWISERVCAIASTQCHGRVIAVLEGGYDLAALAESAHAFIDVMVRRGG